MIKYLKFLVLVVMILEIHLSLIKRMFLLLIKRLCFFLTLKKEIYSMLNINQNQLYVLYRLLMKSWICQILY